MMNGIKEIAESVSSELKHRLPKQRKTQRTKLALLVATMLEVRSANLMDLAAGLPREADRVVVVAMAEATDDGEVRAAREVALLESGRPLRRRRAAGGREGDGGDEREQE